MLNNELAKYLKSLDRVQKAPLTLYGEYAIADKIAEILESSGRERTKQDIAEQVAFDFKADYPNNNSGWGTYYGPKLALGDKEGYMTEYPSIQGIDRERLEYWSRRAMESSSPILSSRYADLVIDLSQKILGEQADICLFQKVIDSNINICKELLDSPLGCKRKIKRALDLSIQTNDKNRISRTKKAIIDLGRSVSEDDDKPGLWGFTFKWLILDFSKHVELTNEEKNGLIKEMEERLKRVEKNPWLAESAAPLLAEHYKKEKDQKNLMRVLGILENSLKTDERLKSDALLKSSAYRRIHEMYSKYASGFAEAEKASKRLSQEIGQLDLDWNKSLKTVSTEVNIKNEDIEKYLEGIFGENDEQQLEEVMANIAIFHLPQKETMRAYLDNASREHPLMFLISQSVISADGTQIAKLSGLDKDYDSYFQYHASQYITLSSIYLYPAVDKLQKRFSKEEVLEYFRKAVLFENEYQEYLDRAISAYWDKDYLVASHLFNSLIESSIRELVKICGGAVLALDRKLNGYKSVSLSTLLKNNTIFENVFSKDSDNILFYFRLVLTERLGMNLRNDWAHGLGKKKFLGWHASVRLFHILILLSLVRKGVSSKKHNSSR